MNTVDASQRLIIALDVEGRGAASELIGELAPRAGWFKIGSVLFTREGPAVCKLVKDAGAKLFLDLKYHDIPNTVYGAMRSALDLGVDMVTVHTSGGQAMLEAAVRARSEAGRDEVIIVGVTVLTHLDLNDFQTLFASNRTPQESVLALVETAQQAGLSGVVASARELPLIKSAAPDVIVVTPGIRLSDAASDDQTRVVTPGRAVRDGADFLVVGRPVIAAPDPAAACQKILADMTA